MKLFSVVFCFTIIVCATAKYVPAQFYPSDVNEEEVHPRFVRSPQYGYGFQPFPQYGFPQFNQGGPFAGSSSSASVSSGTNLNSRFGEDDSPQTQGHVSTFNSNNGVYSETSQSVGPDGRVHTYVNRGRL